jgi:transposase
MQGTERMDRQLLDAGALVGHLVPAGSMFAFLAAHRQELFGDEDFVDLFPSGRGRPSVPASVMASVMVLQVLHDYSDAEAAEAARCDLRWKAACGFPLDHGGFDPSTLVYWRRRLAKSARPPRISDAVAKVITQTGVLKGRRRRAVDSTILADAVATQDTITQLIAVIRRQGGWCRGQRSRSRRCAPATITASPVSRRSTGMTRWPRTRWSQPWSMTRTRWRRR